MTAAVLEAPYTEAVDHRLPLTQMHELERTSLRIVDVVALLPNRVGDMYHLDVEIAGRGGGEEDEGEEECLFSNGCCFVAIPNVRCLIPLHLDKDDGLFFFLFTI